MPFQDDESREAARARLQARRQGSASRRRPSDGNRGRSGQARQRNGSAAGRNAAPANRSRSRSASGSRTQGPSRGQGAPRAQGRSRAGNGRSRQQQSLPVRLYRRLEDILPPVIPPIFVIALVLLAIFLVVVMVIMPTCGRSPAKNVPQAGSEQSAPTSAEQPASASSATFDFDLSDPHQEALVKLLGEETAGKLLNKAMTDMDVMWIAAHADLYSFDGSEMQHRILQLAADEDGAIPFVRAYPSTYPLPEPSADSSLALPTGSPSASVPDTSIPHLYQWDPRWGNASFADNALGLSGSGPTCLAMVCQGLTGNTSKTPYDIGQDAEKAEAVEEKLGMKAEYLYDAAEGLGLSCAQLYPTYDAMRDALLTGQVIILQVEAGYFTSTDSFVVLTGLSDDGQAIMNDPFSTEHSSRTWDLDELAAASTSMYVYSV